MILQLVQCSYCLEARYEHVDDKCLWEPTSFHASACLICKQHQTVIFYEIVQLDGTYYFLCTPCITALLPTSSERIRADFDKLVLDILRHERDV